MAKLISKTYGEALFELSIEHNNMDELFNEAKAVLQSIRDNEDFIKFLNNPQIESAEKLSVTNKIFEQFVSTDMAGFINTVVDKGRANSFEEIFEYFIDRVKEYKKIGVVFVTTPLPLSDTEKSKVSEKILSTTDYESLEINYSIDETLIGGMVLRIGDRVVDSSIKNKLNSLVKDLRDITL